MAIIGWSIAEMGRSMLRPYKNNPERSLTALRSVRDDNASSRRQLPEAEEAPLGA